MRGNPILRVLKAVDLLAKPSGTTINEMVEELQITKRTVYRIMQIIENLGFPVYDDEISLGKIKTYRLDESYLKKLPNMSIPDMNLTLSEIISLYMLKGGEVLFKGTEIENNIESSFKKLAAFLPDETSSQLEKIRALLLPSQKFVKDYSGKEEIIDILTNAMLQTKICHIQYHAFHDDKIKAYIIHPLHFFKNNGGLYLFIKVASFNNIRTIAVERIATITETDEFFEYPEEFNPAELIDNAFNIIYDDPIDVKIWFSAEQARYMKERKWSQNQSVEENDDGSIILSMSTSGSEEIKRWVLSYGRNAKVLEPEALRENILEDIKSAISNYGK